MSRTDEYGRKTAKCRKCGKNNVVEGCVGMVYSKCINCLANLRV